MNRTKSLLNAIVIAIVVATATYFISLLILPKSYDKNSMSEDRAAEIVHTTLADKCAACHDPNAEKPFLNDIATLGLIGRDMKNAYRAYNMTEPMTEVSLAKLQFALGNGRMPPARYTVVHWGTTLNPEEAIAFDKLIKANRRDHFSNGLAAPKFAGEPVQPIPDSLPTDPAKVALGKILYHDVRLSNDNTVSCATCHALEKAGTDNLPVSVGVQNKTGGINAPTVFNAAFHFIQFWDGRAKDLREQAGGPPLNPKEMGYSGETPQETEDSWNKIIAKLMQDEELTKQFLAAYPDGYSAHNITDAIAEYEKTLITPNSPFDQYLKGDDNAISKDAKKGYAYFKKYGCYTCHVGTALGGQSFEFADLKGDFFGHRKLTNDDRGRINFTKNDLDIHRFRVPNLRNVELTWPYMHDASCNTLEEAVDKMFANLVGIKDATPYEKQRIVDFLRTLTGDYEGKPVQGIPSPR